MRARLLKPGFFKSDQLSSLSPMARLLFAGLWLIADRSGRLEDRPARIKGELFPYESVDVEALLQELSHVAEEDGQSSFVHRYQVGSVRYLQVVNFLRHQTPHMREAPSIIPAPDVPMLAPCEHNASTVLGIAKAVPSPAVPVTVPVTVPVPKDSCPETAEPVSRPPVEPALLTFPTDGEVKTWNLTQSYVDELRQAFPSLDVLAEARKALAWIGADPARKKTARGMRRFLVGWLGRAQNNGQGRGQQPQPMKTNNSASNQNYDRAAVARLGRE